MAKNETNANKDEQNTANAQIDQTVQSTADANVQGDSANATGPAPDATAPVQGNPTDTTGPTPDAAPAAKDTAPVPPVPPETPKAPKKADAGKKRVMNPECAGLTLYGVRENKIEFDANGIAEVDADDFEHFLKVPGYEEAK